MKKQIEFVAGYHEWNLLINKKVVMTIDSSEIDSIVYNVNCDKPATRKEIEDIISCYIKDSENMSIAKLTNKEKVYIVSLMAETLYIWYCD